MDKLVRYDTEPLFQSEEFESLLKEDSLLQTFGSSALNDLLAMPSNDGPLEELKKFPSLEQPSNIPINDDSSPGKLFSSDSWCRLEVDKNFCPITQKAIKMENDSGNESDKNYLNAPLYAKNIQNASAIEEMLPIAQPSLCNRPWAGNHDFTISLDMEKYHSTKWGYSTTSNKLYVMPHVAVPVEVSVKNWIDAYINVTPVYKKSQYHSESVQRCFTHRKTAEEMNMASANHIIQLENDDAAYSYIGGRYCAEVPLGLPAPGESKKLVYIKCGCWNTCTGGPNRRQILIIFTLFLSTGEEVGRQVLEVKSCQCPIRDMGIEDERKLSSPKKAKKKAGPSTGKSVISTGNKRKLEVNDTFEQIVVPTSIAPDVKRYINMLMAEKFVKQNAASKFPFPQHTN